MIGNLILRKDHRNLSTKTSKYATSLSYDFSTALSPKYGQNIAPRICRAMVKIRNILSVVALIQFICFVNMCKQL